jgi:HSP20 family protein
MAWDPFRDLVALHERLERLAGAAPAGWTPPMDLYETSDEYVVVIELPGIARADVEIELVDGRLTVRGRRPARDPDPAHYHQVERGHGPFARAVALPEPVRADAVRADLRDGVLTITLPKADRPAPRQIEVT